MHRVLPYRADLLNNICKDNKVSTGLVEGILGDPTQSEVSEKEGKAWEKERESMRTNDWSTSSS